MSVTGVEHIVTTRMRKENLRWPGRRMRQRRGSEENIGDLESERYLKGNHVEMERKVGKERKVKKLEGIE